MRQRSRRETVIPPYCHLVILVLAGCLLAGCTPLPNTAGYTTATIQLKQAVAAAGSAVDAELRSEALPGISIEAAQRKLAGMGGGDASNSESTDDTSAGSSPAPDADKFKQSWDMTVKSLDAMVVYAQSIEGIVDAGNQGAESAKHVAASVANLLSAVDVTGVASKKTELVTDTGAYFIGEGTKFVAGKRLEETLDSAGPVIAAVDAAVQQQMENAERLFKYSIMQHKKNLRLDYQGWTKQEKYLDEKQMNAATELVKSIKVPRPTEGDGEAKRSDGASGENTAQPKQGSVCESTENAAVTQLESLLGQMDIARKQIAPHVAEYETKLSQIREREKAGLAVIGAAKNAVAAWSTAHQEMVRAVEERRPVSVESLTAAVVEVRALIERWREL